jgi:hypothetical protein
MKLAAWARWRDKELDDQDIGRLGELRLLLDVITWLQPQEGEMSVAGHVTDAFSKLR